MKAPRPMLASLLLIALVTQGCDAVSALARQMLGGFNPGPTPSPAFRPVEVPRLLTVRGRPGGA